MEQERDFTLDRSRYYRPPLDGHIGDLCTDDLELSAYGEAVIDRHCFPEMTSFKDRQWHCFLCPASFHSPWSLTDHVIQLHPEEHAFFLENNPDHLTKCPIDEETHWLLSDVMNHCQEFHPDLECGPSTQLGSANYFREVLGTHLRSFPALLLSVAMTGSWVAEDPKLGKVVVQYYPRSDDVPTEDKPGIMTIEMP